MSSLTDRPEVVGQIHSSTPVSSPPSVLLSPVIDASDSSEPTAETPTRPRGRGVHNEDDQDLPDEVPGRRGATYTPRVEKLENIVQVLRDTKMSFEEMIETWVGSRPGSEDAYLSHRQYRTVRQRREAMSRALRLLTAKDICQDVAVHTQCASELDELITFSPFSKFTVEFTLESLDYQGGTTRIQEVAPTWYHLLHQLLNNRRSHRPTYSARDKHKNVAQRIFTVTSIVCFSRARQSSNTFSSCLDLYLVGSGVHRRVIETLHGFGICHSYHHANSLMKEVAEHASVRVPPRSLQSPSTP
jgi:hypothetical protein